jgi:hypothetical protein
MATKLATSSMKSDLTLKTFVTFRVTGDSLVPDEVTRLLKVRPTYVRVKGQPYSTGKSENIIPSTNMWFFSTEDLVASQNLFDHVRMALFVTGLLGPGGVDQLNSNDINNMTVRRLLALKALMLQQSAKATMTFFWHGASGSIFPKIPDALFDLLKLIEVDVDIDFDKDEETKSGRKHKAA